MNGKLFVSELARFEFLERALSMQRQIFFFTTFSTTNISLLKFS